MSAPRSKRGTGLVRPPRRPEGWTPPGPPATGPGDRTDLWPDADEDLCFLVGDWRLFQKVGGHRTSLDDLLTASYGVEAVAGRPVERMLDLGCGVGSVLLRLAWHVPGATLVGVEAQAISVRLAERSIAYDGVAGRVEVRHGDLRDPTLVPEGAVFDLVTGTPPYLPIGDGVVSRAVQKGPCRFERRGGIEGYCQAAGRLLARDGRFVVCHPDVERTRAAARLAGLSILRRRDVIPRSGRAPRFSLYVMARSGNGHPGSSPPVVDTSLVVRDPDGKYTAGYLAIRAAMGMPPTGATDGVRPTPSSRSAC